MSVPVPPVFPGVPVIPIIVPVILTVDYDDTTKGTSDFFSKPFPSKNSVKITTETTVDGLLLKTATSRLFTKVENVEREVFETTIEPKYVFKDCCTVELKLQTSNALSATVTKSNLFTKGFKLSLNGTQEFPTSDVQQTINATAEFQHEKFFFKATGGLPLEEGRAIPLKGTFVVKPVENFYVGTKYNFAFTKGENAKVEKDIEFKVAGSSGNTSGYVTGSLDKKVGVAVTHTFNTNDVAGVNVRAEFPAADAKVPSTKLSFDLAGQHKLTNQTTFNGKLNLTPGQGDKATGIRFGLGLQQKLNCCHAIATFGADINVASFLGTSGHPGHSLGFELKLKD
jgi:hypothetical protein